MPYLAHIIENGEMKIVERPDEPFVPPTPEQVRDNRDHLLSSSDWTQVADAPVDQAAWAAYRQALRDIPQQEGFPHNVAWPVKP